MARAAAAAAAGAVAWAAAAAAARALVRGSAAPPPHDCPRLRPTRVTDESLLLYCLCCRGAKVGGIGPHQPVGSTRSCQEQNC
jgi:hypothetical protein